MTSVQREAGWQEAYIDQNYWVAWMPGAQVISGILHIDRGLYEIARDRFSAAPATSSREAPPLAGRVVPLYEGLERIGRGICLILAGSVFYPIGFGLATTYLVNKFDRQRSATASEEEGRDPETQPTTPAPLLENVNPSNTIDTQKVALTAHIDSSGHSSGKNFFYKETAQHLTDLECSESEGTAVDTSELTGQPDDIDADKEPTEKDESEADPDKALQNGLAELDQFYSKYLSIMNDKAHIPTPQIRLFGIRRR